ncbi:hypothetical protein MPLSOD_410005 [Mesorhizobium sp. SOD10]|nr:hypothetical protein MPLSOD_410005 [Mesorhizobium sp. SOD10]
MPAAGGPACRAGRQSSASLQRGVRCGTLDEVSSPQGLCRSHHNDQDVLKIGPLQPSDPHEGRAWKPIPKRSKIPRETPNAGEA